MSRNWEPDRRWFMRRRDDCLQCAVATLLQVPREEVPDPHIDEQLAAGVDPDELERRMWIELKRWAARRRWRIVFHKRPPVDRDRWLGISPPPAHLAAQLPDFADHTLVMSRHRLVHDPMRAGSCRAFVGGYRIEAGITFDREWEIELTRSRGGVR